MTSGVLAFGLLVPLAHAGDETQRFAPGFEARVWSPWPETVQRGWAPIFVELRNEFAFERSIEIEASCGDYGAERKVRTALRLEPEASATLEVLVPLGGMYTNDFQVLLRCDDGLAYFGDTVGSSSANSAFRQVLLLSERAPEAGAVERWSEALSTTVIAGPRRVVYTPGGAPTLATSGTPPPNDVDVAHASFAGMPQHHAAYSSLDLVVLDPEGGMPSVAQLDALVAWVRTGGDLLVLGEYARDSALAAPFLAAWMEPRFETKSAAGSAYRCGLGRLFVGDGPGDLEYGPYVDWAREMLDAHASLTPSNGPWRGAPSLPSIPGLVRLPYRAFAALLILFALVIGPVNFLAVRKRKNPVLLLLTIPAIALLTTVALLAYGILYQGIEVKSASNSVAVLDQREHRSACVEARQFFAGLAPAAGLALGPGTIVHAVPPDGSYGGSRKRFEVELEQGTLLRGDYLPSRKSTDQVLTVERAERARLDVRRSSEGLHADNNLGVSVSSLIVRDPEGTFYLLEGPLGPGASAELRSPDALALSAALDDSRGDTLALTPLALSSTDAVPPGCYLAHLERSPFRDDCGIETNELAGTHVVLGVLPLEPEAWR
jgi:hypothetical protein